MLNELDIPEWFSIKRYNNLLVDTDILSDIAKEGKSKIIREKILEKGVSTLFCIPSIFELGFGTPKNINIKEKILLEELMLNMQFLEAKNKDAEYLIDGKKMESYKNNWIPIIPQLSCWHSSKKILLNYIEDRDVKIKNAKELQFDALISMTAWNNNAMVWTNNIKDHLLVNYYSRYYECSRYRVKNSVKVKNCLAKYMPPIFDTEMLIKIINREKFNLYDELASRTKDHKIKEILEITKKL